MVALVKRYERNYLQKIELQLIFIKNSLSCFQLLSLSLPNHWIKHLFLAHMYSELQHTDEAFKIYQKFVDNGFANCTYIQAQIAIAHDNSRSMY